MPEDMVESPSPSPSISAKEFGLDPPPTGFDSAGSDIELCGFVGKSGGSLPEGSSLTSAGYVRAATAIASWTAAGVAVPPTWIDIPVGERILTCSFDDGSARPWMLHVRADGMFIVWRDEGLSAEQFP